MPSVSYAGYAGLALNSYLDEPAACPYHLLTSWLFGADLGFHAEWLRDEP